MLNQRRIQVVLVGQRELEHDLPVAGQPVEPALQLFHEQPVRLGLVGAFDAYLGLDDRHEPALGDCVRVIELLVDDGFDPVVVRFLDKRAHFGTENALIDGRSSNESSFVIGFISCTPFSASLSPWSTFTNGTMCFCFHRNAAVSSPLMARSMVCSKRMVARILSPEKLGLDIRRSRIWWTRSNICSSPW